MAGWGDFFGKIAQQFKGRVERLKSRKMELIDERHKLLSQEFNAAVSLRLSNVSAELRKINDQLEATAKD